MVLTLKKFYRKHKKYAPVIFFIGGFIWDSLTLERIDGWYSNTVLLTYLICLTLCIYIFNRSDDGSWEDTFLEPYEEYAPLAIQFFLGGLSSAYVIFFFRSVTLTKTMVFFFLLLILLFSNELLKNRISNKYLQFGAYFFVNFTFFTFFIPILFGAMNTFLFAVSGFLSLGSTIALILFVYLKSPSTRKEITGWKLGGLILGIYLFINICYTFNLIPPVPLALKSGLIAYNIQKKNHSFLVRYEQTPFLAFWKSFNDTYKYTPGDTVFVFTSIFAPSDLEESVQHEWRWYDASSESWKTTDTIKYNVIGGREGGFRGYTFKENVWPGIWRVNVRTSNGMVLGKIDFKIVQDTTLDRSSLKLRKFD